MEKMSRVKKNEELYDALQSSDEINEMHEAMKALRAKDTNTSANHNDAKNMQQSFSDNREVIGETGEFSNEYLDSFIQEIKEYNMKKGIREVEDTNLDILKQLSAKQRLKRSGYHVEESQETSVVEEPKVSDNVFKTIRPYGDDMTSEDALDNANSTSQTMSNNDIAKQVQQLISEDDASLFDINNDDELIKPMMDKPVEPQFDNTSVDSAFDLNTSIDEINNTSSLKLEPEIDETKTESAHDNHCNTDDYINSATMSHDQLVEHTQQIKTQLDCTNKKVNVMQEQVEENNQKTTKLLNIIIIILVVLLLGIIAMIGYTMINGGSL